MPFAKFLTFLLSSGFACAFCAFSAMTPVSAIIGARLASLISMIRFSGLQGRPLVCPILPIAFGLPRRARDLRCFLEPDITNAHFMDGFGFDDRFHRLIFIFAAEEILGGLSS